MVKISLGDPTPQIAMDPSQQLDHATPILLMIGSLGVNLYYHPAGHEGLSKWGIDSPCSQQQDTALESQLHMLPEWEKFPE